MTTTEEFGIFKLGKIFNFEVKFKAISLCSELILSCVICHFILRSAGRQGQHAAIVFVHLRCRAIVC